ncbi:hypothetical protein [Deinococcus altitudinis]|uniref:hypothetical protein n=1 Tax=Deinococcus altitudinis TaxID=468914 RepID=UPI0038919C4E
MNKLCLIFLLLASSAVARPYPDARPYPERLGICYGFKGDDLVLHTPCIIAAGYGAGLHYVSLTVEKTDFYIEYSYSRPNVSPTLNGKPAISYQRDASFFFKLTGPPVKGEDDLTCTKTTDCKVNICYFDPSSK